MKVVERYSRSCSVKSRSMTHDALDLVIELRVTEGSALVREAMKLEGITSASLMSHDGEVTF